MITEKAAKLQEDQARPWPIAEAGDRVVVVLGNGASISEMAGAPNGDGRVPPTDRDFLQVAEQFQRARFREFLTAFEEVWAGESPYPVRRQRMEQVFATTYFLVQRTRANTKQGRAARALYDKLVLLLRETLYSTTNLAEPTQLINLLDCLNARAPAALDVISFNYDVLADRALRHLARQGTIRWNHKDGYGFKPKNQAVPKAKSESLLLKLHGSMNWYIPVDASSKSTSFNPNAKIYVPNPARGDQSAPWQRRQNCEGHNKKKKVFPLMVPPVFEKGTHIHGTLNKVWAAAQSRLESADVVIVWGYSMPPTDYHTEITFAQGARKGKFRLVVVNPNRAALARVMDVAGHRWSRWFFDVQDLLGVMS